LALRESDAQYFKDWAAKHPDYWKQYRANHPEYVERNRERQHQRNQVRLAKDDSSSQRALPSGRYRLVRLDRSSIANEDEWIVEITIVSEPLR
jgi:hypothetical protein